MVIQARAGQVRSLTRQESMAATFADIMTAAARAGEEITRAATLLAATARRLTHSSNSPATWSTQSGRPEPMSPSAGPDTTRPPLPWPPTPCESSRKGLPMP